MRHYYLTQIFVNYRRQFFASNGFIFDGINGGNCFLPPKIARAAMNLSILSSCNKSGKIWHVATCHLQTCYIFEAMGTHPDIGLFITSLLQDVTDFCNLHARLWLYIMFVLYFQVIQAQFICWYKKVLS